MLSRIGDRAVEIDAQLTMGSEFLFQEEKAPGAKQTDGFLIGR